MSEKSRTRKGATTPTSPNLDIWSKLFFGSDGKLSILKIYGLLLVTGICGGYLLGKANSPDFNDRTFSPALIRSVVRRDSGNDCLIQNGT